MNNNIDHIGERIKQRRLELGLTQEELANKVGYKSRTSINKIELSRSLPLKKIEIMANALETSPAYLMGWLDNSNGAELKQQIHEDYIIDRDYIFVERVDYLGAEKRLLAYAKGLSVG